ncbi:MAG: phenylalanine--tRNA ligase alpha subunit [Lysobacterales bacterium]|jgi:phenylalanyl-tRNA synthetase alpha chain|nr:MAG: phenylalanine--tRNA ligase alpha subunit [Xanthomonadales bacterium]
MCPGEGVQAPEEVEFTLESIERAASLEELERVRVALLGRHGSISEALKSLGTLPPELRRQRGQVLNRLRDEAEARIAARRRILEDALYRERLAAERIDVTMPGRDRLRGSLHPLTITLNRIVAILEQMGFRLADGPEIEDDWHNFEALNFPPHHPARAMHDTFYLPDGRLLRTHTSPVQLRAMREHRPPLRVIAAGKVYRSDSDQTHSPMFHQVEGLVVDEGVSFAQLKGTLSDFVAAFFERGFRMRFRPSYFPFTEPSAEVDLLWEPGDGSAPRWLEVLGCGMVHPRVLKNGGIDPERYTGFAFGLGVERFAMLRYGVSDLRAFFDNDLRFLAPFV